jgi:nucleoside-diphosphate-sugar epimerase
MEIAVFGGTGFMGYDFVKLLIEQNHITPLIFTSNPANLSNIARHDFKIQFFHLTDLGSLEISRTTDLIVNFTHPFQARDGLSASQQIELYLDFFRKQLGANSQLKLIHISSMSVYEPFGNGLFFSEDSKIKPPRSDNYAFDKYVFEQSLLEIPGIHDRLLILRPTIVYGPFCRPWTDNILSKFLAGDCAFFNLSGKIQPIFVADISRFLLDCIHHFHPGIFNLGGSDIVEWHEFLTFFEKVACQGQLLPTEKTILANRKTTTKTELKKIIATINQNSSFVYIFKPLLGLIPDRIRVFTKNYIRPADYSHLSYQNSGQTLDTSYCQEFFAQDRLVSMALFDSHFPSFRFSGLSETLDIIRKYYNYRFTDKLYA